MLQKLLYIALLWGVQSSGYGQVLFEDNFDDPQADGWEMTDDPEPRSGPGNWLIEQGQLKQKSNIWSYDAPAEFIYHLGTHATAGDSEWTDYTYNAILRSSDDDGIGIIFRYQDPGNYYRILLMNDAGNSGSAQSKIQRIQKFVDGEPRTLLQNKVAEAYPPEFFSLTADVRGDSIRAYLNGELIGEVQDSTYKNGKIGVLAYANSGAAFDSILVTKDFRLYEKPDITIEYPVTQNRYPYIQKPTPNSVEIAWRTVAAQVGTIEYGKEKGVYTARFSKAEAVKKHHFRLPGLEPDTRYFYRVKNDENVMVKDVSFVTPPSDSVGSLSFFVLGDSGVDTDIQREVRDQMLASHLEDAADFLIHVGDVHQGDGSAYDDIYFNIYRELIQSMNFFLSIGNHDTYTDNGGPYLDDFYLPANNPDSTEKYYTHRWGNAFFLNIDSNQDFTEGSAQYKFIKQALESEDQQTATWTFAYFHHPPYCEFWDSWEGSEAAREHLLPLFEEHGVDIIFNGHTHAYERAELNGIKYVISGGGGGGLDGFARDFEHIQLSRGVHHFSRVDIEGDRLTLKP